MSIIKFNNRYYKLIPFIVILLILSGFIIVLISSAYNLHVEQQNIKNVKPEPQIIYVDKPIINDSNSNLNKPIKTYSVYQELLKEYEKELYKWSETPFLKPGEKYTRFTFLQKFQKFFPEKIEEDDGSFALISPFQPILYISPYTDKAKPKIYSYQHSCNFFLSPKEFLGTPAKYIQLEFIKYYPKKFIKSISFKSDSLSESFTLNPKTYVEDSDTIEILEPLYLTPPPALPIPPSN